MPVISHPSAPSVRLCQASDLHASSGDSSPSYTATSSPDPFGQTTITGFASTPFYLQNLSPTACSLTGWPRLRLFGDNEITSCGPYQPAICGYVDKTSPRRTTFMDNGAQRTIIVGHGQSAQFSVVFAVGSGIGDDAGPYVVDVSVPEDEAVLAVRLPALDHPSQLTITSFAP